MLLPKLFAAGTVLLDIAIVLAVSAWLLDYAGLKKFDPAWMKKIGSYRLEIIFLLALGGSLGSIILEYVTGWQPCMLCWYQRIFLYPQVFLAGTALLLERQDVTDYLVPLNLVGGAVAVYHYMIQMIENLSFGCSGLVDCSNVYATHFGYVTIPVMSLTVFAALLLVSVTPDG
ncbi:MAG: disulfide bond formation protein B [Candidatus Nanohaloarchaea archaeon]